MSVEAIKKAVPDAALPAAKLSVAEQIADAVLSWMVKHDLLDADNEYRATDVLEVLNDLAPESYPAPSVAVKALDADDVISELANMPCETQGSEDLEAGCCRTCRARSIRSALSAQVQDVVETPSKSIKITGVGVNQPPHSPGWHYAKDDFR